MAERAAIILSAEDRTKAAFASAKKNLLSFKSDADIVSKTLGSGFGQVAGVAGLLGTAISTISFRHLVDGVDALNDLKDATGANIENLSALEDIANRNGQSLETVGTALVKLNKILNDSKADSDTAETLKRIGLNAEELKQLDPAEAFQKLSIAINQFADDGKKGQLILALTGKTAREIGPLIKDVAEAGKLNATVTTAQAQAAEDLNKQIFALQKNIKDGARAIAGDLIPIVSDLIAQLVDGRKAFGNFTDAILTLGTLDPRLKLSEQMDETRESIARVGAELDTVRKREQEFQQAGFTAGQFAPQIEVLERQLDLLTKTDKFLKAQQARGALKLGEGVADDPRIAIRRPSAPDLPDQAAAKKAAEEALATLRKLVDGNLRIITAGLNDTQDVLRHHEQVSQALFDQGVQSIDKFYADQDQARQQNLDAVRQATDAEIAERERLLKSALLKGPDKQSERQDVRNQIAQARASLAAAERESDQQQQLATIQRQRAVEQLRDNVAGLQAQINDLATGKNVDADLLQIAQRVREAGRVFIRGGDDEKVAKQKAAELGRLLEIQRQFAEARENFARVTDEAARAEETLQIAQRQGGVGLVESEDQVRALRTKGLEQIEAMIAKTRELLALNPRDSNLIAGLQELELQAAKAREAVDPRKLRLDLAADDLGSTIADGFQRATIESEKLRDVVKDIAAQIQRIVTQEVITKPLGQGIANVIKGAGGQGTGQNLIGQLFGLNAPQAGNAGSGTGDFARADRANDTAAAAAEATAKIAGLGSAAGGSADVLGKIPELAAIPATTALGALAGAAQIAAANLLAVGGASAGSGAVSAIGGAADLGQFFSIGGYTGNAPEKKAAGIVHGKEFVLSAPAVRAIGVPALEELHQAALTGKLPEAPVAGQPGAAGDGGAAGAAGAPGGATAAQIAITNLRQVGTDGAPGGGGAAGANGAPGAAAESSTTHTTSTRSATHSLIQAAGQPGAPGQPGEGGAAGAAASALHSIQNHRSSTEAPGLPVAAVSPGANGGPGGDGGAAVVKMQPAQAARAQAVHNIQSAGSPGLPGLSGAGGAGGAAGAGAVASATASPAHIAVGNLLEMAQAPRVRRDPLRYHTGGIVGQLPDLKANEVPLIAERGEELLTRNSPRHRDNAGPVTRGGDTFNVHLQGKTDSRTPYQIANAIALEQRRASRLA